MMLKTWNNQNSILTSVCTSLPDDRPITSIQIVEYIDKCPRGFCPISKTHDQDQDADLWRDSSFLKRSKSGRYLCISKSEGLPNFVVREIAIVNEKSLPPEGFSLLNRTADTEQKAWRKKQLCFKLVNCRTTRLAVTDIIVCNRLKKAPDGFTLAGEINGMTICYKMGNVQDTQASSEFHVGPVPSPRPQVASPGAPAVPVAPAGGDHDYEILLPDYTPRRPAPGPPIHQPAPHVPAHTLGPYSGLEGVPFVLNPRLQGGGAPGGPGPHAQVPHVKARTAQTLDRDYSYDFSAERHS